MHLLDAVFYADKKRMSVGFEQSGYGKAACRKLLAVIDEGSMPSLLLTFVPHRWLGLGYKLRALQRSPHVVLLDHDWYHVEMKPVLAEWCVLWLEKHHVGGRSITRDQIIAFLLEPWATRDQDLHEHLAANLGTVQVCLLLVLCYPLPYTRFSDEDAEPHPRLAAGLCAALLGQD